MILQRRILSSFFSSCKTLVSDTVRLGKLVGSPDFGSQVCHCHLVCSVSKGTMDSLGLRLQIGICAMYIIVSSSDVEPKLCDHHLGYIVCRKSHDLTQIQLPG